MNAIVTVKAILILSLGLFVSLATVPRCDTLKAIYSVLVDEDPHGSNQDSSHCHEQNTSSSSRHEKLWQDPGCECELFEFHVVTQDLYPHYGEIKKPISTLASYSNALLIEFSDVIMIPLVRPPIA